LLRRLPLIAVGILASFVLAWSVPPLWAGQFREIVVFGDSETDSGNFFAANGWPDPNYYYQGRWSNGPVWVERLAARLGVPDPSPSLLGGTNYAWGGAETGPGTSPFYGVPNTGNQLSDYILRHHTLDAGVLIVAWGGLNDFEYGQTDPSIPVSNLVREITLLAQHGGKYFLVANLFPSGDVPGNVQMGPQEQAGLNLLCSKYNSSLAAQLSTLETTLGITIFRYDDASVFDEILNDPAAFGFANVTDQAKSGSIGSAGTVVANPDQYLFWDGYHFTRVGHQILGDRALGAMFSFTIAAPGSVASGSSFDVTVTALDPFGDIDIYYQGTVTFSTSDSDPGTVLPADYTFTLDDAGVHAFAGAVTLITPGDQTLRTREKATGITGLATITVSSGP
jgi:phospholipase/lecithinase/hemolysin